MNCIIEQFIVFRTNDGHKGYFQKTRSLDGESVNFSYYGISREQARTAKVLENHSVETAATAYWDYHFNMLSQETQKLIKVVFPGVDYKEKSTLRMPNELATLARAKALKVMGEICPKCSGMGWYPGNIGNGTCFRCNGRGKILPKITDEFLEEFSKRLGGGKENIKTVSIPACENHEGLHSIQVKLRWICPICGKPRGDIKQGRSYDGSLYLSCDTWENPCGHIDKYSAVRQEAKQNGLNGGGL